MRDISTIRGWHAHVYFHAHEKDRARELCEAAAGRFGIDMGRMHDGPVGPHPKGSCQLSIPPERFGEVIAWLVLNRDGLTVLVHPRTGDDLADHRDYAFWLGRPATLDLSIFV